MVQKVRSTQADVAKLAGVSQAMVSYIVNDNPNVTIPTETRQRILDAMSELGYVPNALARGLRSGQTKTIGLIVLDNTNPFIAELAHRIEDISFEKGYSAILCNSNYFVERENTYVEMLLAKQVDGVILIPSGDTEKVSQRLRESKTPFAIIGHDISGFQTDSITIDYQMGGYLATRHLLDLGHQKIGCITDPPPFTERVNGYYQALSEAGLPTDPELVVQGDFRITGGEVAATKLLKKENRPTAIFACNDLMAIGVVQAAHKLGIKIPDELSVVGFDDIPFVQAISPSLTTIVQPTFEIARIAMDMLFRQLLEKPEDNAAEGYSQLVLQPQLVIRNSTCENRSLK